MPNYLTVTAPASGNFTITSGTFGQSPLYTEQFTVVSPLAADIKLFLTADSSGTEQTVIQPTTEYFAYPYDTNGTLLTADTITWVFPGQLTAPSNVAFTLSGTEAVGSVLTASAVTYDGGLSTITYSWNGTGTTTDQPTYLLDAGDEGNTVTVTVTATNNGGTANGTATTGTIDPYAPPSDWDTYSIAVSVQATLTGSNVYDTLSPCSPTGTAFDPDDFRFGFNGWQVRNGNTSNAYVTAVPYIAIWNVTTSIWTVHAHGTAGGTYQAYSFAATEPSGAVVPVNTDDFRVVGLSQYTAGDVANWNNYA